jgi:glycosyltransferase involved in cell wall biosynthesis
LSPIELGGYSPKHPFMRAVQRAEDRACRDATKVISILPKAIDHLETRGLDETRYRWTPNGVSLEDQPRNASPLLHALSEGPSMVVAYAGGLAETHDLMTLLRAALLLKDEPIAFALIGDGPAKERLRAFVAQEHLDRVHFFDRIPRNEALAACAAADVMYIGLADHPLYRFGIGLNKIADAMLLAKPIVAAYTAANDPVGDAKCGTRVAAGDADAVAHALRSMQTVDRATIGNAGRAYVAHHHDYDVLAAKFLAEIESC